MKKTALVIIGMFLLIYILPLGVRPLMIPDETRYAEIPREMIASGDWIVPRLNGLRYFEKPVLGYWITAGAIMLFGENAFAARLPSALAVGFSSLILFLLVKRFGGEGRKSVGLMAAVVFLTCLEVFGIGTFNLLDGPLSLFITGAMASFFYARMEERPGKKNGLLLLSGIACGLAFLTKGFIAFAVPLVAVVPFMIWERRGKEIFKVCWVPIAGALLVSLPWAVLIHTREPDFWRFFFWNEHIRRFMAENAQHRESFWYFFLLLPASALPWTFLVPAVISGIRQIRIKSPLIRFAICWFLFPFLFFSISRGKLLTYIMPCFPPLAVLIATGLRHYFEAKGNKAFFTGVLLFALVIAILAIALSVVQTGGFDGSKPYVRTWKWILVAVGFLPWNLFLLLSVRESRPFKKTMLYAAAPLCFLFTSHFALPDPVIDSKAPGEFLLRHAKRVRPDTILVSGEALLHAVCWFYRRNDASLIEDPGELAYGLRYTDSRHRLLELDQFREIVLKNRGTGRVTLVAKVGKYEDWKENLPGPVFEDRNGHGGFVFAQF